MVSACRSQARSIVRGCGGAIIGVSGTVRPCRLSLSSCGTTTSGGGTIHGEENRSRVMCSVPYVRGSAASE